MPDIPDKPDYTHGSTGTAPASARNYQNGDPIDADNLDYYVNTPLVKINAIIDFLNAIDTDGDGKVDAAEQADNADTALRYKNNDIDTDGDGKVDVADQADTALSLDKTIGISYNGTTTANDNTTQSFDTVSNATVTATATVSVNNNETYIIEELSGSGDIQRNTFYEDEDSSITFELRVNKTPVKSWSDTNNFSAADQDGHQFSISQNSRIDESIPTGATVELYGEAEIENTGGNPNNYDLTIDVDIEDGYRLAATVNE